MFSYQIVMEPNCDPKLPMVEAMLNALASITATTHYMDGIVNKAREAVAAKGGNPDRIFRIQVHPLALDTEELPMCYLQQTGLRNRIITSIQEIVGAVKDATVVMKPIVTGEPEFHLTVQWTV